MKGNPIIRAGLEVTACIAVLMVAQSERIEEDEEISSAGNLSQSLQNWYHHLLKPDRIEKDAREAFDTVDYSFANNVLKFARHEAGKGSEPSGQNDPASTALNSSVDEFFDAILGSTYSRKDLAKGLIEEKEGSSTSIQDSKSAGLLRAPGVGVAKFEFTSLDTNTPPLNDNQNEKVSEKKGRNSGKVTKDEQEATTSESRTRSVISDLVIAAAQREVYREDVLANALQRADRISDSLFHRHNLLMAPKDAALLDFAHVLFNAAACSSVFLISRFVWKVAPPPAVATSFSGSSGVHLQQNIGFFGRLSHWFGNVYVQGPPTLGHFKVKYGNVRVWRFTLTRLAPMMLLPLAYIFKREYDKIEIPEGINMSPISLLKNDQESSTIGRYLIRDTLEKMDEVLHNDIIKVVKKVFTFGDEDRRPFNETCPRHFFDVSDGMEPEFNLPLLFPPGSTASSLFTQWRINLELANSVVHNFLFNGVVFRSLYTLPGLNPWLAIGFTSFVSAVYSTLNPDWCIQTRWWPFKVEEIYWSQFVKQSVSSMIFAAPSSTPVGLLVTSLIESALVAYTLFGEFYFRVMKSSGDLLLEDTELWHNYTSPLKSPETLMGIDFRSMSKKKAHAKAAMRSYPESPKSIRDKELQMFLKHLGNTRSGSGLCTHLAAYLFWQQGLAPPLQQDTLALTPKQREDYLCSWDYKSARVHWKDVEALRFEMKSALEILSLPIDSSSSAPSDDDDNHGGDNSIIFSCTDFDHPHYDIIQTYSKLKETSPELLAVRLGRNYTAKKAVESITKLEKRCFKLDVQGDRAIRDLMERLDDGRTRSDLQRRASRSIMLPMNHPSVPHVKSAATMSFSEVEQEIMDYILPDLIIPGSPKCLEDAPNEIIGKAVKHLADTVFTTITSPVAEDKHKGELPVLAHYLPQTWSTGHLRADEPHHKEAFLDLSDAFFNHIAHKSVEIAEDLGKTHAIFLCNDIAGGPANASMLHPYRQMLERKLTIELDRAADLFLRPYGMTKHSFLNIYSKKYCAKYPECADLTRNWLQYLESKSLKGKTFRAYLKAIKVKDTSGPKLRVINR